MATILDVGALNYFAPVFVFILVFVLVYAILLKTHLLGDNKGLISVASFVIALLFIITQAATEFVQLVTPWFVVLIIVSMCFLLIFMFLGVSPGTIAKAVTSESYVWLILVILIVLLGLALTKVVGPGIAAITQGEDAEAGFMTTVGQILFHPKILGVLFILLVASFAIRGITKSI